jgi:SHS2 domain-containing protein
VAALTDSYADTARTTPTGRHEFRLTADSTEQGLVSLLDEAVYLLDARGAVVVGTHVEPAQDSTVGGWFDLVDVDAAQLVGSVPKGIALSGLQVRQTARGWWCTVTVNV